jgi:biopolymer transport protein ExbB
MKVPGGDWTTISGQTLAGYTTPPVTIQMNGNQYRCIVIGAENSRDTSNAATLQVTGQTKPKIITNPDSLYVVPVGRSVTIKIEAVGLAPLQYQWDKFNSTSWIPLTGETADSFSIITMDSSHIGLYRARVWNDSGTDTSTSARITTDLTAKITINTTGTVLSGSVNNFPLLVRLNSSNFDFSLARGNGTDIRFKKNDETSLPFERERYDSAAGLAEFWVLLDQVLANNNTQSFKMYWGDVNAADSSNPEAVFKTANNFAGVWHLAQGNYSDATSNNNDAIGQSAVEGTGVIGNCKDFDGAGSYINCGSGSSLDNLCPLTIEAWIYADGWGGNSYGRIVDKGNDNLDGLSFFVQDNTTYGYATFAFMRDPATAVPDSAYARAAQYSIMLSAWYHVIMVFGADISRLYINGVEPSSYHMQSTMPGGVALFSDADVNFTIGNTSGTVSPRPFDGRIDEVRVSNIIRTADWIKLTYETQRIGQTVVTIE